MNDSFHIGEILKDGFTSIVDLWRRLLFLVIIPICLSLFVVLVMNLRFKVTEIGSIISALAIFTGFFFTLIVYVSDKAQTKKKEFQGTKNVADKIFLEKYLSFSEGLIVQISYSIVTAIVLIVLYFLTAYDYEPVICKIVDNSSFIETFVKSLNIFSFAYTFHFLIFLLLIVSNMYAMFLEDVNTNNKGTE